MNFKISSLKIIISLLIGVVFSAFAYLGISSECYSEGIIKKSVWGYEYPIGYGCIFFKDILIPCLLFGLVFAGLIYVIWSLFQKK